MGSQDITSMLALDMKAVRSLNPQIIPAGYYYSQLLKKAVLTILFFWAIITTTIAYSGIHNPSNKGLAAEPFSQIVNEAALMGFFMALIATLLLSGSFGFYLQLRFHLEKKIQSGRLLVKKCRQVAILFMTVFSLLCLMFGSYAESAAVFLMIGFAFFGSLGVTYFVINLELKRIGLSTMYTAINEFVNRPNRR